MVSHKGVAKSIKHDEPECRRKGNDEKCGCCFKTAPGKPPGKIDDDAEHQPKREPAIGQRIVWRERPTRIAEREVCRPEQLRQVKPDSAAGNENALHPADGEDPSTGADMMPFPPNRYQAHGQTRREEWS